MHKCPDIECHDEVKKIGEALKVWKRISFVFGAPALGVALVVWGTVTFAIPEKYCPLKTAIKISEESINRDKSLEINQVRTEEKIQMIIESNKEIKDILKAVFREMKKNH